MIRRIAAGLQRGVIFQHQEHLLQGQSPKSDSDTPLASAVADLLILQSQKLGFQDVCQADLEVYQALLNRIIRLLRLFHHIYL